MKIELNAEAKDEWIKGLLEKAIKKFNLDVSIESEKSCTNGETIGKDKFLVITTQRKKLSKSLFGTKEKIIKDSFKALEVKANEVPYTYIAFDDGWNEIKVKSNKSEFDDVAIWVANELEKEKINVTLCINNLEKVKEIRRNDNPSRR